MDYFFPTPIKIFSFRQFLVKALRIENNIKHSSGFYAHDTQALANTRKFFLREFSVQGHKKSRPDIVKPLLCKKFFEPERFSWTERFNLENFSVFWDGKKGERDTALGIVFHYQIYSQTPKRPHQKISAEKTFFGIFLWYALYASQKNLHPANEQH